MKQSIWILRLLAITASLQLQTAYSQSKQIEIAEPIEDDRIKIAVLEASLSDKSENCDNLANSIVSVDGNNSIVIKSKLNEGDPILVATKKDGEKSSNGHVKSFFKCAIDLEVYVKSSAAIQLKNISLWGTAELAPQHALKIEGNSFYNGKPTGGLDWTTKKVNTYKSHTFDPMTLKIEGKKGRFPCGGTYKIGIDFSLSLVGTSDSEDGSKVDITALEKRNKTGVITAGSLFDSDNCYEVKDEI